MSTDDGVAVAMLRMSYCKGGRIVNKGYNNASCSVFNSPTASINYELENVATETDTTFSANVIQALHFAKIS